MDFLIDNVLEIVLTASITFTGCVFLYMIFM